MSQDIARDVSVLLAIRWLFVRRRRDERVWWTIVGREGLTHPPDPIARAYAVIGLRPGASAQQLKQQYKRLVKTWHPDRWASDPVNQAEATQRMRAINEAYATLHRLRADGDASERTADQAAQRPDEHWSTSHRSMTDEELNAIVRAIGDESFVSIALRFAAWFVPMAAAYVPIARTRRDLLFPAPITRRDWTISAALFFTGLFVLLSQMWSKRQSSRSN
jgi:DnaJ-domain-containing protein 1